MDAELSPPAKQHLAVLLPATCCLECVFLRKQAEKCIARAGRLFRRVVAERRALTHPVQLLDLKPNFSIAVRRSPGTAQAFTGQRCCRLQGPTAATCYLQAGALSLFYEEARLQ